MQRDGACVAAATHVEIPRHMMTNINPARPTTVASLHKPVLSGSQESYVSAASSNFGAPALLSSSSNISTSTAADTESTSPSSSNAPSSQSRPLEQSVPPSPSQARGLKTRPTPSRIDMSNAPRTGDTAGSPMSLDSPVLAQGSKRTASGAVKGLGLAMENTQVPTVSHKRNKSTESGSNPRIGQLSAQLKTRLSYAMVKVQNGWEKQSLEELEERTSQQGSPISAPGRSEGVRPSFDSPRPIDRRRRPSGVSETSDQMMISPGQSTPSDPARSLATTPSSFWRSATKPQMNAPTMQVTFVENGPILAPAPELGSRRKRRSSASYAPPPLLGSSQRKHYSDLGVAPRTPTANPRAGILRMPSQQAEKDAVDTLLFLSSPNNSSRVPHVNTNAQAQHSPLRSENPGRRVMFESNILNGPGLDGQHPRPGHNYKLPNHHPSDRAR